jgi:hypothetical protein
VPDRAGILQERLELRCEDRVTMVDRILRITDYPDFTNWTRFLRF